MASVSMHKSGGSLTPELLLLTGRNVNPGYVSQIINLTQTTSASYLLLSSLDISRRNLALNGKEIFKRSRIWPSMPGMKLTPSGITTLIPGNSQRGQCF